MNSRFAATLAILFSLCLMTRALGASPSIASPTTRPVPQIRRVLLISIDGLRPDVLLRADAPRIKALMDSGAFTLWARSTPASITLPTHVSMLTGVTPEVHAITWNADLPLDRPVWPLRPSLFELAKKSGYTTAMATGKNKLVVLDKPGTLDWKFISSSHTSEDAEVTERAIDMLSQHKPDLFFVHLPSVDNVGHAAGWGTPQQLEAMAHADACVGRLLDTAKDTGVLDETLVIVTADHGGAGRSHGAEDARSRTIPWILWGPGVRKNFDLSRLGGDTNIEVYDTFATAAAVLGIPVPRKINGRFVKEAFEDLEILQPAEVNTLQPVVGER
jgi:arylsulfatase A-like enzyme